MHEIHKPYNWASWRNNSITHTAEFILEEIDPHAMQEL
jgi:hypothetical protein